jgi:hypothetical protein
MQKQLQNNKWEKATMKLTTTTAAVTEYSLDASVEFLSGTPTNHINTVWLDDFGISATVA